MFEEVICSISLELQSRRIPYMLIGGQAVLLYGEPRLTRDIDITLGVDVDKLQDIISLADKLMLKILPEDVEKFVRQTMVLPLLHEKTGIRVDFIFSFSPYERQAIERAKKVRLMDQDVCFAAPEDVVIHKILAGRPRDMEDVAGILQRMPDMNFTYMRDWISNFSAALENDEILNRFESMVNTR